MVLVPLIRMATVIGLCAPVAAIAQMPGNWSGEWSSVPKRDVILVRSVAGSGAAHGWQPFLDGLVRSNEYRVTIKQSSYDCQIEFPVGANNLLNMPAYVLADTFTTTVEDHGAWWVRHRTRAQFSQLQLMLEGTTSSGWWKTQSPDSAPSRTTDFRLRVQLSTNVTDGTLLLRVTLSDEKGEVEYTQRFQRTSSRAGAI